MRSRDADGQVRRAGNGARPLPALAAALGIAGAAAGNSGVKAR